MMVAQRLLRMPTPAAASVLRPTGPVPDVKLVKPSKVAEYEFIRKYGVGT